MKENNLILDKFFGFALEMIELYKKIVEQKEYVLSKQILIKFDFTGNIPSILILFLNKRNIFNF